MDRSCEKSIWWNDSTFKADRPETGVSRINSPRTDEQDAMSAVWPFTMDEDWCGGFSQHPDDSEPF